MNARETVEQEMASAQFPLVGIGASAGGLAALERLLPGLPPEPGLSLVIILHLAPGQPSHLAEALQRFCAMPVQQVTRQPTEILPNRVYVIAPGTLLKVEGRYLLIDEAAAGATTPGAIDYFLHSLAASHRAHAVGVLLSGMGKDGCSGLAALREAGGAAIVQLPHEAQFPVLPQAAVDAGQADMVLAAAKIAPHLLELCGAGEAAVTVDVAQEGEAQALQDVLEMVRERTGHDFRHYKLPTILRRLERRLLQHGTRSIADYRTVLAQDGDEASRLMKELLIGVTGFFRDSLAFERLRDVALRAMMGARSRGELRAWVAACSTGQEAYSLAMLLSDLALSMPDAPRIHIFASDVDEQALDVARTGLYAETIREEVPPATLERYFVHRGAQYGARQSLRDLITFAGHDLLRDPPFSGLDLITCRNFMIYLDRPVQKQLLERFHFGLGDDGYLFLGSAETADSMSELFTPVDRVHRIYQALTRHRRPAGGRGEAKAMLRGHAQYPRGVHAPRLGPGSLEEMRDRLAVAEIGCEELQSNNEELTTINAELKARLDDTGKANNDLNNLIASVDLATVVVDQDLVVRSFTPRAASIFNLIARDVGRGLLDITHRLDYLQLADDVARTIDTLQPLEREVEGTDGRHFIVRVRPYRTAEDTVAGAVLTFFDFSHRRVAEVEARTVASDQEFQLRLGDALRPLGDALALQEMGCRMLGERLGVARLSYAEVRAGRYTMLDGYAAGGQPLQGEGEMDALGAAVLEHWRGGEAVVERSREHAAIDGGGLSALAGGSGALQAAACSKGGRWLGFFLACQPSARNWTSAEVALFEESAARIGVEIERARSQSALLASETRLRALLHGMAHSCWEADGAGQVVGESPGWQARTGQAAAEALGEGWLDAVHPDDRAGLQGLWHEALRNGEVLDTHVRLHSPAGGWPRASLLVMPLLDELGDVEKWVGCSIDGD